MPKMRRQIHITHPFRKLPEKDGTPCLTANPSPFFWRSSLPLHEGIDPQRPRGDLRKVFASFTAEMIKRPLMTLGEV